MRRFLSISLLLMRGGDFDAKSFGSLGVSVNFYESKCSKTIIVLWMILVWGSADVLSRFIQVSVFSCLFPSWTVSYRFCWSWHVESLFSLVYLTNHLFTHLKMYICTLSFLCWIRKCFFPEFTGSVSVPSNMWNKHLIFFKLSYSVSLLL